MTLNRVLEPTAEASDQSLLSSVAEKSEEAFERLYKRYYHRVMQFVLRMLRDRSVAEEVVDDTMYAVWKGAERFKGNSAVSTWILAIAYRRALKAIDRNRRLQAFLHDEVAIERAVDVSDAANPEDVVSTEDLRCHIDEAIGRLSDDHRSVMVLTLMGYSYEEISTIVECPSNTVKTRMFYARKKLKGMLPDRMILALTDAKGRSKWQAHTHIS